MPYTYTPETLSLEIKPKHARGKACPIRKALKEKFPESEVVVMRDLIAIDGAVWAEVYQRVDEDVQVDHHPDDSKQSVLLDLHGYMLLWGIKKNYDLMRDLIGGGYELKFERSPGWDAPFKTSRTFDREAEDDYANGK